MDKENMDGDAGESGGDQQPATGIVIIYLWEY